MEKTPEREIILVDCAECGKPAEIYEDLVDMFIAKALPIYCHRCHFKLEMADVKRDSDFMFGV